MIISLSAHNIKISVELDEDANIDEALKAVKALLRGIGYSEELLYEYILTNE